MQAARTLLTKRSTQLQKVALGGKKQDVCLGGADKFAGESKRSLEYTIDVEAGG